MFFLANRVLLNYHQAGRIAQYMYYDSKLLKFGLSEKHTKFEKKIFLRVLTVQLIYLVNVKTMRKIFSNYVCFSKSQNFIPGVYFADPV